MLTNTRTHLIEWGECDAAGIVFYPRYFEMFDHSTTMLINKASGLSLFELLHSQNIIGYPMVDTRATFTAPCRYSDLVTIESAITKVGKSSFDVTHRILKDGAMRVEGFETRVWVGRHPDDPQRIAAKPIPDDLAARFRNG